MAFRLPEISGDLIPALLLGLAALYAAWVWGKRRREERYDLRRLRDLPRTGLYGQSPLLPDEEPNESWVTEESGPYCHICDEAYPAGTHVCRHCRRPL